MKDRRRDPASKAPPDRSFGRDERATPARRRRGAPPSARRLDRLAWKYLQLTTLRARREELERAGAWRFDDVEARDRKRAFRRIAREFPGALRELDSLPASALRRRAAAVERARAAPPDTPREPWIDLALDFHRIVRMILAVRRWAADQGRQGGRRPRGRGTLELAWEVLVRRHGAPRPVLEAILFGAARG
ncbi:MAG TPA: hypothetical protein VN033_04970 [Vulgatibacter sp.]|nr:hypothetical protein [Vulgatibacter sp.]